MQTRTIVAGAAPYGVFPNQPQLYAAQGPPPPTYDQTLTHPMVRTLIGSWSNWINESFNVRINTLKVHFIRL